MKKYAKTVHRISFKQVCLIGGYLNEVRRVFLVSALSARKFTALISKLPHPKLRFSVGQIAGTVLNAALLVTTRPTHKG